MKNQVCRQSGILAPRRWIGARGAPEDGAAGSAESWWNRTECLLEARPEAASSSRGGRTGSIRVGKPQVAPDTPTHVKGIERGDAPGAYHEQVGHEADGTADARRSTGIVRKKHDPIMPNLPPG